MLTSFEMMIRRHNLFQRIDTLRSLLMFLDLTQLHLKGTGKHGLVLFTNQLIQSHLHIFYSPALDDKSDLALLFLLLLDLTTSSVLDGLFNLANLSLIDSDETDSKDPEDLTVS